MARYLIFYFKTKEGGSASFMAYNGGEPVYEFFAEHTSEYCKDVDLAEEDVAFLGITAKEEVENCEAQLKAYKEYPTLLENVYDIIDLEKRKESAKAVQSFLAFISNIQSYIKEGSDLTGIYYYLK